MSDRPRPALTTLQFAARDDARRRAVQEPGDVEAALVAQWPPYSRDELKALGRKLNRAKVARDGTVAAYIARRLGRAVQAINNRALRYRETPVWSMTAPNGREVRFPINDYASTEFKKLVDRHGQLYERTLIDFVTRRLGPGDVFVDVGANVGFISAFAATTGAAVFSLEIQRDLVPLIEQMASINAFDQVRVLHVGASTRSGLSMMPRIEANTGTQLEGQTARFARHETRSVVDDFVPMLALDDAFSEPGLLPTLVKVDVEGHEIGVLEGARRIIDAGLTTFVVEFHPHLVGLYRRRAADLLAPFDLARWTVRQLTDDGLRAIASMDEVRPDPRDPNPKLVFEPLGA